MGEVGEEAISFFMGLTLLMLNEIGRKEMMGRDKEFIDLGNSEVAECTENLVEAPLIWMLISSTK